MTVAGHREPTDTQRFILEAAAISPGGRVAFAAGDRKGTRIGWRETDGTPWIIAYGTPDYFLKGRGWIEPIPDRPNTYRITDAGRDAIRRKRAAA